MGEVVGILSVLEGEMLDEARRLWKLFETEYASKGVQSFDYPNITFQAAHCTEVTRLQNEFSAFAHRIEPFELVIDELTCFPSRVIFLQVRLTKELKRINYLANEFLGEHCENLFQNYLPENWIPHVTVAMEDLSEEQFKRAIHDLKDYHPHYCQMISNLHLVQVVRGTGRIEIVRNVQLMRES